MTNDEEIAAQFRAAVLPLVRAMRRNVGSDLSPSLLAALGTVEREGPMAMNALAVAENVSAAMVTKLAAGLASRSLITRVASSEDRRVVMLEITPTGRRTLDRTREVRNSWLAKRIAELSEDDRVRLQEATPVIGRLGRCPGTA